MPRYRFPYRGWRRPKDMAICIEQLNEECAGLLDAFKARLAQVDELDAKVAELEGAEQSWAEWLEAVAVDLQVLLDELDDVDGMTVGEVRRLRVLGEAVRDGAGAVVWRCRLSDAPPITYTRVTLDESDVA